MYTYTSPMCAFAIASVRFGLHAPHAHDHADNVRLRNASSSVFDKKCRHGVEASFFYLCVNKICIISYYFLGLSPNYEFVVFVFPPRKMSPELMISKRLVASDTKELEHEFQVNECFILFLS